MKKLRILFLLFLLSGVTESAEIGKFFMRSPQSIVAPPGDRVTFQCETNIPSEQVRWKLNGRFLFANDSDIRFSGSFLAVKVAKYKERYSQQVGEYQCVAEFGAESLTSLPASLSIAVLEQFSSPRENKTLDLVEGNSLAIPCDPPHSNPPPIIQFWKDGRPLDPDSDPDREGLIVTDSGVLIIPNVSPRDSAIYWCTVTNHITTETLVSPTYTKVSVLSNGERRSPPVFLLRPKSLLVVPKEGNVSIPCIAVGNPPPSVTWRKLRGLSHTPLARTSPTLTLHSFQLKDEGEYVCEAYNGVGPALSSSTTLLLNSPPEITKAPTSVTVEEGASLTLSCVADGLPQPRVTWLLNGSPLSEKVGEDGSLFLPLVQKKHAGLFQCFASNPMGTTHSPAEVRVRPKQVTLNKYGGKVLPPTAILKEDTSSSSSNSNSEDHESSDDFSSDFSHIPPRKIHQHHKGHHGRRRGGNGEMTPPSRPSMNRVSDDSVMVRWSVPPNSGYPIQFFKIQYKDVSRKGSRWNTIDDDIPPHIHSYEVKDLKEGHSYKFRIAAVYSNNDNKAGPTSDKFVMTRVEDEEASIRRPSHPPVITNALPFNETAILLRWNTKESNGLLDGFFLYYRESTSAVEYQKVTVLGGETEAALISFLKPGVSYDMKVQAFNRAGASPFSSILAAKTMGSVPSVEEKEEPAEKELEDPFKEFEKEKPDGGGFSYVLLGSLFIGFWVVVCLLCGICYRCKQRRAEQEAKYPGLPEGGAVDSGEEEKSPELDFINAHIAAYIPNISGSLEEKGDFPVFQENLNNNLKPSYLNSSPEFSSFKTERPMDNGQELQILTLTTRLRKENSGFNQNSLNRNTLKSSNKQNHLNSSTNLLGSSTMNSMNNFNNLGSLRRSRYTTCSSADELDDSDDDKGSRIFPKEHYKVSRKKRRRRSGDRGIE